MKQSVIVSLLIVTAVPTLLFGSEPSAFGAGDLSSPEPYGLTSSEKVILETKDKLKKVASKSKSQASQLDSLRERIDGLQSIVESIGRNTHNNKINLEKLKDEEDTSMANTTEYQTRLSESIQQNKKELEELKASLLEVSKLLDDINARYVTKDEYNTLVTSVNNFKALVSKELKSGKKISGKASKTSSADLYNLAKKNYDKKYYTKAIANYEELIKRNYKPAYAHYMIGEMNYKRKNYAKAISYFKKSSQLYAKAKYMPNLMLHTAISMEKTGDRAHAKSFYKAIIAKYPTSKEAQEAKRRLGK
ncbi:tetratricopeptide repeat protein [Sulfurimonas paralvinellae]|uniref:Tetratricopeptide repeat protein n=1 Tax=Sulfurimonas paralvinellae TaxID=317658 RepID=A0A7M1B6M6_9BACT|nr:tetratricopeptide repeat protein [Sulfurimonas paralvinellae]QOP45351.1 tetratricopeptide repeat protein [Sulfurimonas paralvinellae]